MTTPTPDNAARAQDGSTDERIIQRNALNDLLDNLSHDAGDVDDFAPSIEEDEDAYWAYHQYHGIVSLRRTAAMVTALEARVGELEAAIEWVMAREEYLRAQVQRVTAVTEEFEGMTGAGYRYMAANIREALTGAGAK